MQTTTLLADMVERPCSPAVMSSQFKVTSVIREMSIPTPVAVTPKSTRTISSKSLLLPSLGADASCCSCVLALLAPCLNSNSPRSTTSVRSTPPTVVAIANRPANAKMLKLLEPTLTVGTQAQMCCVHSGCRSKGQAELCSDDLATKQPLPTWSFSCFVDYSASLPVKIRVIAQHPKMQ